VRVVPRVSLAVLVALLAAVPAGAGTGAADFGIELVAPVNAAGVPARVHTVVAGVPFRVRIAVTATGVAGPAAVTYSLDLPTGIHSDGVRLARTPLTLRGGRRTSMCLRGCSIGWDATRSHRLAVYYALVTPGPGTFILSASISTTNRPDARRADDVGSTTVVSVAR